MTPLPPFLKKNDSIGLIAPASFVAEERLINCIDTIENQWHYKIIKGKTIGKKQDNYFSASDEERLQDLQTMLDNPNIKAILCARGGYGLSRIVDKIDFTAFKKKPKWIIGFSDVTVLLQHIFKHLKISSLHAPMAVSFDGKEERTPYLNSLKNILEGEKINYQFPSHPLNKKGTCKGKLIGGNLTLFNHLLGSKSSVNLKNKILFIEDVGEYIYAIDRMIQQLKRAKNINKLAGLLIGGFTDTKDTDPVFGKTVYETIYEQLKDFNFPIAFNFPASHGIENYSLKIGVEYALKITKIYSELKEH